MQLAPSLDLACSRLSDSGEDAKEKGTRKVGGAEKTVLPSFLPFYFRFCAFTIQRTRLSQSLEQVTLDWDLVKDVPINLLVQERLSQGTDPI